jgi:hypothetical protein
MGLGCPEPFWRGHVVVTVTYFLQPPPDFCLLVQLGLQHLLLLTGQLHLLFYAFLLLYLLKDQDSKNSSISMEKTCLPNKGR